MHRLKQNLHEEMSGTIFLLQIETKQVIVGIENYQT